MESRQQNNQKRKTSKQTRLVAWVMWLAFAMFAFLVMAVIGVAGGYRAAQYDKERTQVAGQVFSLAQQFQLGLQDMQEGRYDLAQQRFEYILYQDSSFPEAAEKLAQVIQIQSATTTPTAIPATHTPTPTRDLRPVDALFTTIQSFYAQGNWEGSVNAIIALRQADSQYRVAEVDGLLYRSLRNRGLIKIRQDGNLEGGIYDLTLAERIGPLDVEAIAQRELARYYMMGSSFWEVYPEQAVYYFGLVASAAPSMRDATGWTAAARYRSALIQYGDQLARGGDWCNAQLQYELALSYTYEAGLQGTLEYAAYQCNPPTDTPIPVTESPTIIFTPTQTLVEFLTPTITSSLPATLLATATPYPTVTLESTPTPSVQPTPTPTSMSTPTAVPSEPPVPTDTPSPTLEPSATFTLPPTEITLPTDLPTQTLTATPEAGLEQEQEVGDNKL
jgi:tetratricopeptide (TPR) repeat protein